MPFVFVCFRRWVFFRVILRDLSAGIGSQLLQVSGLLCSFSFCSSQRRSLSSPTCPDIFHEAAKGEPPGWWSPYVDILSRPQGRRGVGTLMGSNWPCTFFAAGRILARKMLMGWPRLDPPAQGHEMAPIERVPRIFSGGK